MPIALPRAKPMRTVAVVTMVWWASASNRAMCRNSATTAEKGGMM